MALSNELISQYAKVSAGNNKKQARTESTVYGTTKIVDGKQYVKLDGSDLLTPVQSASSVSDNDRVSVNIKNHTATITGNLSDPSASSNTVKEQGDKITEFDIIVADKVTVDELNAVNGRIDNLVSENVTITGRLDANEATIKDLNADNVVIKETLTAQDVEIENLTTTTLKAKDAELIYATITELEATNAYVYNLEATYGDFQVLTTQRLEAVEATIDTLTVENFDATYVRIDYANIEEADIKNFYAKFGMIEDVVIEDGQVTGDLVGVRISGDLITAGTLKADKLVIKGEDGLYYKLNVEGGATVSERVSEEDLQNGLDGSVIIAQSVTADKIYVSDLYAFGATIGGFHITDSSLYSGVKESIDNTTDGVYLDKEGQINFGNMHDFVKFYKTTNDKNEEIRKLEISASSIKLQSEGSSSDVATSEAVEGVEENLQETDKKVDDTDSKIGDIQAQIEILNNCIQTLVTDENGNSLMTQTGSGWTFDISGIEKNLSNSAETLSTLIETVNSLSSTTVGLVGAIENWEETSEYVWVTTYEDEPCLALGESDTTNGLFITNTRIIFIKDAGEPTYIDKDGLYTDKLEVGTEFRHKDFVWAVRANGNYGLSWKQIVLTGIQVIYAGPKNVKVGTDVDKLTGIIVKGTYSNGRVRSIPNYTVSGEIVEGNNTITVSFDDFSGTFDVTGVDDSFVLSGATSYDIGITSSAVSTVTSVVVYYSDSIEIVEGEARLKNASNITIYKQGSANYDSTSIEKLYGKYACTSYVDGNIYYVDPNASFTVYEYTGSYGITSHVHSVSPAYKVEVVLVDVVLDHITVNYTGGEVPVGTSVNELTGITVTAVYSDGSTENVTGYSFLSNSISSVGDNNIAVTYSGKIATFTVTGVAGSSGETGNYTWTKYAVVSSAETNRELLGTTKPSDAVQPGTTYWYKSYTIDENGQFQLSQETQAMSGYASIKNGDGTSIYEAEWKFVYGGDSYTNYYKITITNLTTSKGEEIGTVTSTNRNEYPQNGIKDGYWYVLSN